MILSPRAIALQGMGFAPLLVAVQGFASARPYVRAPNGTATGARPAWGMRPMQPATVRASLAGTIRLTLNDAVRTSQAGTIRLTLNDTVRASLSGTIRPALAATNRNPSPNTTRSFNSKRSRR